MTSLISKDLKDFAANPYGILSIALLLILAYLFLWVFPSSNYLTYGLAEGELYFQFLSYLMLLVVPAFSVNILSNEFRYGTEEVLRSMRIKWTTTITAKFLSALTILVLLVMLTTPHLYIVHTLAESTKDINLTQILGSFIGLFGIGACFIALSLLVTSFVRQNTASYLISVIVCFIFFSGFGLISSIPIFSGGWDFFIEKLSLSFHVDEIARGILSLSTIAYVLAIILWSLWVASHRLSAKEV